MLQIWYLFNHTVDIECTYFMLPDRESKGYVVEVIVTYKPFMLLYLLKLVQREAN